MKNKTLFITCLYNGLEHTILGGRAGRTHHYINSLENLFNMESDFVVYTSEKDKEILEKTFDFTKYKSNVRLIVYDLFSDPKHQYFQKKLNGKKTDRCYEIMHNKTSWIKNHITEDYEFYYWIDCGLSHGGLFPKKYLSGKSFKDYFSCVLFNPLMVENLNKINDKMIVLYGDQSNHIFESKANYKFYENIDIVENCHIVGGMFGGKKELVNNFCLMYDDILDEMIEYDVLEAEEALYTVIYQRNKDIFYKLTFTTWHHEDSDMSKYNKVNEKYFYNIFEKLNQ